MGTEYVVVAVEERTQEFAGMINLNRSGAFLWQQMQGEFSRADLAQALLDRYDITPEKAAASANAFVDKLLAVHVIEE